VNELISKAVAAFRSSPSRGDIEIHEALIAEGLEAQTAARLVEFLPMAYCRLLLGNSGVQFSSSFQRQEANSQVSSERQLSSEPVWDGVVAFAREEVKRGASPKDLIAVAGRSAEFDAVNQMLNKGSNLKDIVLTPTLLTWPEVGPRRCDVLPRS
jgi:hypothetical protein